MKFYFTYGNNGQPFVGGWTEVDAPNARAAAFAFRAFHPDKTAGLLNCSDMYDQSYFEHTEMFREGNFGKRCHEVFTLSRRRVVTLIGRDSWDRPVYRDENGKLYVDVDPRADRQPYICTKQGNAFDGEPCDPVNEELVFLPGRDTWS